MSKGIPIFVVEGHLEHKFLNEVCGNKTKVLKLSNGKSISPKAIAKQVYALISAVSVEPAYVTVIADREKRKESAVEIENEVTNELRRLGLQVPFSVHVPDIMIENWILADTALLEGEELIVSIPNGAEGGHGKLKLDEAFRRKSKNCSYKETIDGVRLLKACTASVISMNSPSFNRLLNALSGIFSQCYWIQR